MSETAQYLPRSLVRVMVDEIPRRSTLRSGEVRTEFIKPVYAAKRFTVTVLGTRLVVMGFYLCVSGGVSLGAPFFVTPIVYHMFLMVCKFWGT